MNTRPWRPGGLRRIAAIAGGGLLLSVALPTVAEAQQFAGDNQWTAPHGVGTFVATAGEQYAQLFAVAALFPDWEFNAQWNFYYDDPRSGTESYTSFNLYAKHRLSQNEAENGGYAVFFGTGLYPEHLDQGAVATAFQSWWLSASATYPFFDDRLLVDFLPGVSVNFDEDQTGETAWGFTYTSRAALYGVIPQSALVAEVFGTAGEAYARPAYRAGVRWESPRWVVAGTYSAPFDGSTGIGFELGVLVFTDPVFCFGGCGS